MQLNSINSVSFQGSKPKTKHVRVDNSSGSYESGIEKAQEKAKQDVHLSTVVAGVGIMAAAVVKGKNIIALATKAVATVGETIAKGAIKAVCGTVNVVQSKKGQAISPDKALDKVSEFAGALRNENPKACTGLVEGTRSFIGKIFGKEKGDLAANFLINNGMDNKVGLAQGVLAGAVGAQIADGATDNIENALDNRNISKAERAEETMNALENLGTVIEALTNK